MQSRLDIAFSRPVRRRAVRYAIVVGALLIAINQGTAIAEGDVTAGRLLQMIMTILVPYAVSTLSSVDAARETPNPRQAPCDS